MSTVWNSFKMLGVLLLGLAGGAATDRVVDAGTHVPIGVAVSVTLTAVGVAIYIAKALQKLQDSVNGLKEQYEKLPCVGLVKTEKREECKTDEKD